MSDIAIRVDGLSKRYRIGVKERQDSFGNLLVNLVAGPARNLRRLRRLSSFEGDGDESEDIIWALRDVSFEVKRGEVVGIIGPNGAGKTTLLKILSRITEPTSGQAEIRGRVSSLLEVGTGFHPELTGRDNVYLNGSLLGMSRAEISRKFDELVDFSGVEKFIDTPVKRYSSGMRVRLAFSVAAHLEPEVLLIDEVLAVGDAAFQVKCLGKMEEVSGQGRTVLFVSHNMGSIGKLCPTSIVIDEGRLAFLGESHQAIERYLQTVFGEEEASVVFSGDETKVMSIESIRVLGCDDRASVVLDRARPFRIEVKYEVREPIGDAYVAMTLSTADQVTRICNSRDIEMSPDGFIHRTPGLYMSIVEFPGGILNVGRYYARVGLATPRTSTIDQRTGPLFDLMDHGDLANYQTDRPRHKSGILALPLRWSTEMIDRSAHPSST